MTIPASWIFAATGLTLLIGVGLIWMGREMRRRRGLGDGKTISLDRVTLTSLRLGLTGRPDRLIRVDGTVIVEEWKSSPRPQPSHRAQMGVYFLLVEDQLRVRPSHGFLVTGDGTRHRIENDDQLRGWVLDMAGQIRRVRANPRESIAVRPHPGQCRSCGMRSHCGQGVP